VGSVTSSTAISSFCSIFASTIRHASNFFIFYFFNKSFMNDCKPFFSCLVSKNGPRTNQWNKFS
jgi:hypothetical protein